MQAKTQDSKNKAQKSTFCIDRRGLLTAGVSFGLLFSLGAVEKAASKEQDILLPPGHKSKKDFFTQCLRCGRCMSICPQGIIQPASLSDGIFAVRAPKMDFHLGSCDFCNKCIDVCPTGALQPYEGETFRIGTAVLNSHCISLRTGACTKCYEECPYDAIEISETHRLSINEDKCNGCGKCFLVCPALILQSCGDATERGVSIQGPFTEESHENK